MGVGRPGGHLGDDRWDGPQDDFHVEQECQFPRVADIQPHHFLEGGPVLSAHLPQAGQARDGVEAPHLPGVEFVGFVGQAGARPDEAHVAEKDVDQLGELVDAGRAENTAEGDDPGVPGVVELGHHFFVADQLLQVVLVGGRVGVRVHRAELPYGEYPAEVADPFLPEQDRAGRDDLDEQGDQQEQGRQNEDGDKRSHDVDRALPHGDPEQDIWFQLSDRPCAVRGVRAGGLHPGVAGLPRHGRFSEGARILEWGRVIDRKPRGWIDVHHALRGGAAVVCLADVGDKLPGAFGLGVREDRADAAVRKPSDGVGRADPVREDGNEVPGRVVFPASVADIEDGHGEFLASPVGAVTLPVEDRSELPGGMNAIEDLCVPKPGQRVDYMDEIPFHRFLINDVFVNRHAALRRKISKTNQQKLQQNWCRLLFSRETCI